MEIKLNEEKNQKWISAYSDCLRWIVYSFFLFLENCINEIFTQFAHSVALLDLGFGTTKICFVIHPHKLIIDTRHHRLIEFQQIIWFRLFTCRVTFMICAKIPLVCGSKNVLLGPHFCRTVLLHKNSFQGEIFECSTFNWKCDRNCTLFTFSWSPVTAFPFRSSHLFVAFEFFVESNRFRRVSILEIVYRISLAYNECDIVSICLIRRSIIDM